MDRIEKRHRQMADYILKEMLGAGASAGLRLIRLCAAESPQ